MLLITMASADEYLDEVRQLMGGWRGPVFCDVIGTDISWRKACEHKATVVRKACSLWEGRFAVWLDADARIKTAITQSMVEAALDDRPFGCRWREGHIIAGTILIDCQHELTDEWLGEWETSCLRSPGQLGDDMPHLEAVALRYPTASLSPEWAWIEPDHLHQGTPPDPTYVWHTQASRRLASGKGGRGG